MKILIICALLLSHFEFSNCLVYKISKQKPQYCFQKYFGFSEKIHLSFTVTGESLDDKIDVLVYNPKNQAQFGERNTSKGVYMEMVKETGVHKVCFISLGGRLLNIQFHFNSISENTEKELAPDSKYNINLYRKCEGIVTKNRTNKVSV
jgi:hypothetical protein